MSPYLRPFLIPVVVFGLLSLMALRYGNVWESYKDILFYLPFVLFAAAAVMALYLLQYGFFYTALLFAALYAAIQLHLQTTLSDPYVFSTFLYINLFAPILVMFCVLLSRKPVLSVSVIMLLVGISSLVWISVKAK